MVVGSALALPSVGGDFDRALAHVARVSGDTLAEVTEMAATLLDRACSMDLSPRVAEAHARCQAARGA